MPVVDAWTRRPLQSGHIPVEAVALDMLALGYLHSGDFGEAPTGRWLDGWLDGLMKRIICAYLGTDVVHVCSCGLQFRPGTKSKTVYINVAPLHRPRSSNFYLFADWADQQATRQGQGRIHFLTAMYTNIGHG